LAAELAYRFFLALFPFAIFLTALAGFAAKALGATDPSGDVLRTFGQALPAEVAPVIGDELRAVIDRRDPALISIGAIAALITATGGTNAILKGLARVYQVRTRPLIQGTVLAVGLTLAGGWLVVGLFVVFFAVQLTGAQVAQTLGVEPLWRALLVVRWLLAIPVLIVVSATLYRVGTTARPSWRAVLAGAALGSIAWVVVTVVFSYYVDRIGSYGATYGALAGVAGLLVWLYLSGFVLLLGGEVSAFLDARQTSPPASPLTTPVETASLPGRG
jgi:membrane protein